MRLEFAPEDRPCLPRGVRVQPDRVRGGTVLLAPEKAVRLDPIGEAILARVDGQASFAGIVADLAAAYDAPAERIAADVQRFLVGLRVRRHLDLAPQARHDPSAPPARQGSHAAAAGTAGAGQGAAPGRVPPPVAMLAELTHRCPLSCPYCSNPVALHGKASELPTEVWADAFRQAADLGVLQLHLSGGEPASRPDLVALTAAAHEAGLYTNLITSGIGLTPRRLDDLEAAGLDHIQLSLQGTTAALADWVGGYRGGFERKMAVAEEIRRRGIPLTLNAVMHRHNLDDLDRTIEMAVELGARRLEVACVQFHGWAVRNRAMLLPTRAQTEATKRTVAAAAERLRGVLAFDFVPPDYYADYPKACMGGWGSAGLNIAPDGKVLPCHAAETIPHLVFDRVTERPLAEIWYEGAAFEAYRGTDWLPEPCAGCERREIDFGGCRCQALAIAGDAGATDPVCRKSPLHGRVAALLEEAMADPAETFEYRTLSRG